VNPVSEPASNVSATALRPVVPLRICSAGAPVGGAVVVDAGLIVVATVVEPTRVVDEPPVVVGVGWLVTLVMVVGVGGLVTLVMVVGVVSSGPASARSSEHAASTFTQASASAAASALRTRRRPGRIASQ
jgi:hypothetical protein